MTLVSGFSRACKAAIAWIDSVAQDKVMFPGSTVTKSLCDFSFQTLESEGPGLGIHQGLDCGV